MRVRSELCTSKLADANIPYHHDVLRVLGRPTTVDTIASFLATSLFLEVMSIIPGTEVGPIRLIFVVAAVLTHVVHGARPANIHIHIFVWIAPMFSPRWCQPAFALPIQSPCLGRHMPSSEIFEAHILFWFHVECAPIVDQSFSQVEQQRGDLAIRVHHTFIEQNLGHVWICVGGSRVRLHFLCLSEP